MPIVAKAASKPSYVDVPVPEAALRREHALVSTHQPRFSRAFLKLVRGLITPAIKRDLKQALQEMIAGRMTVEEVVNVVPWYNPADPMATKMWEMLGESLRSAYAEVVEDAGDAEMRSHNFPIRFTVQKAKPDIRVPINPYSVRFVQNRAAAMVAEVSEQQRTLLRKIISGGFEAGERPVSILQQISDLVGLIEREWRAVVNRDKLLASTGMPDQARRAAVAKYRDKLLKQRAQRIARTETVDAYTEGIQDSWQMASDEGIIEPDTMKEWMEISASPRTCPICRGLGGQQVPIDQPFISDIIGEIMRPTAHPHCRCTMTLVPEDEMDTDGAKRKVDEARARYADLQARGSQPQQRSQ